MEKSLCGRDKPENQYLMMMLMMRYSKFLQFYVEDHYSEIVPLFQIESPLPCPNLFGTGIFFSIFSKRSKEMMNIRKICVVLTLCVSLTTFTDFTMATYK